MLLGEETVLAHVIGLRCNFQMKERGRAGTGDRTRMALRPRDFKSRASASFAIPAPSRSEPIEELTLSRSVVPSITKVLSRNREVN
jgi:hypothetical protein